MNSGNIQKMKTQLDSPVSYHLPIGEQQVAMNPLIGETINLTYNGQINCVSCGRKTNKSFSQGHCYPCMKSLAQCDTCIVKPELCHFDEGTCRDESWALQNCMQDHYVYLANSSGIKVGITRGTQVPTRWIDQGATQALPIIKTKNRLISGLIEVAIKEFVSDRTDWRKMLKGNAQPADLFELRSQLLAKAQPGLDEVKRNKGDDAWQLVDANTITEIQFPVETFPEKIKSLNFDKTEVISGVLQGIKGQYLILDSGVLNIRKFGGYSIELAV